MAVGGALFEGNSELLADPLKVVRIAYNGYDLGKTTAESMLEPDQDIFDVTYQQDGTKSADNVRTGIEYMFNTTFGEIKTGLLIQMMKGITSENTNPAADSGTIGRALYESMRENESGVLKIAAVDSNGAALDTADNIMYFYEAIPVINGALVNWGADTQRNMPVQFRIKFHEFASGESSTKFGAFGYWGDPTVEDVPAVVWPDVEAPILSSASVTLATEIQVVFNENIAFQTAFAAGHYTANVDGLLVAPTAGVIATTTLTLTFPAATFANGDIVELTITGIALEDTAATANLYAGVDGQPVVNTL